MSVGGTQILPILGGGHQILQILAGGGAPRFHLQKSKIIHAPNNVFWTVPKFRVMHILYELTSVWTQVHIQFEH